MKEPIRICLVVLDMICKEYQEEGGMSWWEEIILSRSQWQEGGDKKTIPLVQLFNLSFPSLLLSPLCCYIVVFLKE